MFVQAFPWCIPAKLGDGINEVGGVNDFDDVLQGMVLRTNVFGCSRVVGFRSQAVRGI
jgi:hypothetical protein